MNGLKTLVSRLRRDGRAGAATALLAGFGMVGLTPAALAANADVTVDVVRIPLAVSVKRPGLDTYASYQVLIKNNTTNVINNVVFSGYTVVPGSTDAAPQAGWKETIQAAPYCTAAAASIQCSIGQLKGASDPAGSAASFVVIFKAPATGTSVDFVWQSTFSSGNSASTPPASYVNFYGTASTGLTTLDDPTITKSFITSVPTVGGTFCTGYNCLPSTTDEGATQVKVPNRPAGDGIAQVSETSSEQCAGNFACVTSAVSIPGVFDNLVFTLTRSGSYIQPGLKIANTPVYYTPDGQTYNKAADAIGLCVGFGTLNPLPPANATDRPCIAFRTQYPNNYKPEPNLSGAMQWVIYSRHNGIMRF